MTFVLPGGLGQIKAAYPNTSAWNTGAGTNLTFSNNNRTVTSVSTSYMARAIGSTFQNTGKLYFEVSFSNPASSVLSFSAGAASPSWPVTSGTPGTLALCVGGDTTGYSIGGAAGTTSWGELYSGTTVIGSTTLSAPAANDVVGVAIDCVTNPPYLGIFIHVNGRWFQTGTTTFPTNPDQSFYSVTAAPACSVYNAGTATLNTGNAAWAYAPPAGFTAWG